MALKIHWSNEGRGESGLFVALCGWLTPKVADLPHEVTCKRCARALEQNPPTDRAQAYVEGLFSQPIPIEREAESGPNGSDLGSNPSESHDPNSLPTLTPETYKRRSCTCGAADCDVCHFFAGVERDKFTAPWRERWSAERFDQGDARFRSLAEAFHFYMRFAEMGVPVAASSGAALMRLALIGTRVQQPRSRSGFDDEAIGDFVHVERAIAEAYTDHDWDHGATFCVGLLLLNTVGRQVRHRSNRLTWEALDHAAIAAEYEIDVKQVRAIVRHGRKRVRAALRARGMLPA